MFFPALLSNVRLAEGVLNLAFQSLVFLLAGWILSLLFKRASAPARSAGMLALILILALWPLKISLFPYVTFAPEQSSSAGGGLVWFGRVFDREFRVIKQFTSEIPSSLLYPPPPPLPPPPPPRPGQQETTTGKPAAGPKADYQAIPDCIDFGVADDKIFLADTREGFRIAVFDAQGNPIAEIKKKDEKLRVPPGFRDEYMKLIREKSAWLLNVADFQFREYYPAFMSFNIADGKIYVATHARRNGMNELIVMDLKGDILKRSFSFPLHSDFDPSYNNFNVAKRLYAIYDGRIFFLMKNEKTNAYELQIKSIE